jgi:hypothetical protein
MVTPRSTATWPSVGLLLARDHPEQRRLAGTVGTDEADLLPLLERSGGLDEENLAAILLADVVETNHVLHEVLDWIAAPLCHAARSAEEVFRSQPPLPLSRGSAGPSGPA